MLDLLLEIIVHIFAAVLVVTAAFLTLLFLDGMFYVICMYYGIPREDIGWYLQEA
jgi:hypothetical protein